MLLIFGKVYILVIVFTFSVSMGGGGIKNKCCLFS